MHPAVLDACLQVAGTVVPVPAGISDPETYLPFEIGAFHVTRTMKATRLYCRARRRDSSRGGSHVVDLCMFDEHGQRWGWIENLVLARAERGSFLRDHDRDPAEWLYDVQWQEQPKALSANFLTAPATIAESVRPSYPRLLEDAGFAEDDHDLLAQFEHLSRQYILDALEALGCSLTVGQTVTTDELVCRCGILPAYEKLLGRFLQILGDGGYLVRDGRHWRVVQPADHVNPERLQQSLREKYAGGRTELTLLDRCGTQLAEVLAGRVDPQGLLLPQEGIGAEDLYHNAPSAQLFNGLAGNAIEKAIEALPADRRLRVLEIGAGTGGTTSFVLPVLPPERA
jgi:hypothetical protein